MKKVSLLLLLAVCLFTACQNNSTNTDIAKAEVNVSPSADKEMTAEAKPQTVAKKLSGYKVGDTAEDFSLKNIDGKMFGLKDFKDAKGYIVIFTCNSCPYAVRYEDRIIALNNEYASKGYPVIAINPNDPDIKPGDSFENMIVRAKEKGFTFPYVFDAEQKVFPKYGATKTPHIFILNKDLVVEYIGAIDNSPNDPSKVTEKYVENAITALMNGKKPNPSSTKAIGCSVKVKR